MKNFQLHHLPIGMVAIAICSCSTDESPNTNTNVSAPVLAESASAVVSELSSTASDGANTTTAELAINQPPPPSWTIKRILDRSTTSTGQIHTQQTPIATKDGYVYMVGIEPGPNGDGAKIRQTTTIKQGQALGNGEWQWQTATITDNTVYDRWHTPPSVGVDRNGFIHIAYNMHNTPWQYAVSQQPHSIEYFEFNGQHVSNEQLAAYEFNNITKFDSLGTASLPGSQITYPAFFKNNAGELHITYRAAAKPARPFWERTMSGVIAQYDEQSKQWNTLGAKVSVDPDDVIEIPGSFDSINALAAQTGWTIYHPKLDFDANDNMHVMWFWRPGVAGAQSNRPCHAQTSDNSHFYTAHGEYLDLPVNADACGNMGYNNDKTFVSIADIKVDNSGQPHILVSPSNGPREIIHYDNTTQNWIKELSPRNATHLFFDNNNRQWVLATGLKTYYRDSINRPWVLHYEANHNDCFAKMVWNETKTKAYIHTQDCQSTSASIYELSLN